MSVRVSRGSARAIDPGRNLCHEPTKEFIEQTLAFHSSPRAVTQGNGNHSLAQDIAIIPHSLCEQSLLSLFPLLLTY